MCSCRWCEQKICTQTTAGDTLPQWKRRKEGAAMMCILSLIAGPHVSRNSKSSPHYRHPILNHCKTNCSTDPRSARKVTSTSSRILPRSPDWQLINLLWLQSLLLSDRAWARAEDSPMPGCVHPRWSTCLDQTLSTGRGQDGKDQKKGVLGISTGNKTKQITSCQGVSLLSGRANVCNQALRARPLNETGHE